MGGVGAVEGDLLPYPGHVEVATDWGFVFLVDFEGVEGAVGGEAAGDADGGVADEGAYLEGRVGVAGAAEDGEERTDVGTANHLGLGGVEMSPTLDGVEDVVGGGGVGFYVVGKGHDSKA